MVTIYYYLLLFCQASIWKGEGASWSWSHGSWIYNYICNHCLSPLQFEPSSWLGVPDTTLCDKSCQGLATGRWFFPVSSTDKTDRHDIIELLLKVTLCTIKPNPSIWKVDLKVKITCCWSSYYICNHIGNGLRSRGLEGGSSCFRTRVRTNQIL